MEEFFDKIAANDPSITEVNIVGNVKFQSLSGVEKVKAGGAFARNTHVKCVMMSTLGLDDDFAEALGESIASNATIEKLLLDSNSFSGEGMKALFKGLSRNTSIVEMQVRHQTKKTSTKDEDRLPELLEPNGTIIKVGIDLRSQLAKMKIEKQLNLNRERQRKLRASPQKYKNG
jgi:hypothetical protein